MPVLHCGIRLPQISPICQPKQFSVSSTPNKNADRQNGHTPVGKVGLISSATGDYRHLTPVTQGLVEREVGIGISSLRMDRMPEVLIDCMVSQWGAVMHGSPRSRF